MHDLNIPRRPNDIRRPRKQSIQAHQQTSAEFEAKLQEASASKVALTTQLEDASIPLCFVSPGIAMQQNAENNVGFDTRVYWAHSCRC